MQKAAQRPEKSLEKPSGLFGGFWGVRRAVLNAVKSLQSPTEKICERCGRQRQGRKSLYRQPCKCRQSRAGTRIDSIKPQECRANGWREALQVVWGVLGASEGSPKGRKKCTKPYRKDLRTVQKAAQRPEKSLEYSIALRVVWGVLGGSEGSPKGRKKSTKPYRKTLRTVRQAA